MQTELKVRKILGRTYLNENRLAEALDVFSKILVDYPDDLETLLILGNFYLASGDGKTAKSIYLRAQKLDPTNKNLERQIEMADELHGEGLDEPTPTELPAVARLLQRLTGKARPVSENDILRAATLLEKIIHSDSPAELVALHLDEIDELLPALIELNIRQAYSDGRPELAEALRSLQLNIDYQIADKPEEGTRREEKEPAAPRFEGSVLVLLPDLEHKSGRMALLKPTLETLGCRVSEKSEYLPERDGKPDVVIASNPHVSPFLAESLSVLSGMGVPVIVDLDTDFEKQPVSHPEYNTTGLGTQTRSNAYSAALSQAQMITAPSEVQAASLKDVYEHVCFIPDGWSRKNMLWEKDAPQRNTVNIGWVGSLGQLEDLVFVRRYIIRIIREFPNTRIVIIGNPQAYRLFAGLPENRRLYLPVVAPEEFPYLLSQVDVLLVPLRNQPFNLTLPDTVLMEAGAKGVPWIASPIPAFRRWMAGGMLAESLDEWHLNLRHLVMDEDLRRSLGKAGRYASRSREMNHLGKLWLEVIRQVARKTEKVIVS